MVYLLVYPRMVVPEYVSTYLGWRAWYSFMVWRYGTVNGYPKPKYWDCKADIIMLYPSYFGTIQHLTLWVRIFLAKIYCLNIVSYWPEQTTGRSPSFILTLNQTIHSPLSPLLIQYLETVVACHHNTLQNQQHNWSCHWVWIPYNEILILEQPFPFVPFVLLWLLSYHLDPSKHTQL